LVGLLAAAIVAGAFGLVTSYIIARFRGLALIMITLGIGLLVAQAANSAGWLTGGNDGLQGIQIQPLLGYAGIVSLGHAAFFGIGAYTAGIISKYGFGEPLVGLVAAAAVAGALLTHTTETVSLDTLSFQRSADIVIMLILGGTGRLYGGIVGAIVFLVARDQLAGANPQYWYFWIGILLMLVVLLMPRGILGGLAQLAARVRK
jgi:branched-chain amino acid transport system permease protein